MASTFVKPDPIVDVESFAEVSEAWRCPAMSSELTGPGDEYYHLGTVMRLDGPLHVARRRSLGQLLKKRGHKYFRDTWLLPTADSALAEVLDAPESSDGLIRVDLLAWARLVNQRLAAAITGFDEATTSEGAQVLFDLVETLMFGRPSAIAVVMGEFDTTTEAAQQGIAARDEIIDRFYKPSIARRKALVEQVKAGELSHEELPQDLLTLIALESDPAWSDPEVAQREAIFLLSAGVHTTSSTMIWTLREIFQWVADHPGRLADIVEEEFLLRAGEEAMRLHPVVPGFARVATETIDLNQGTQVPEGALAVLRSGPASVDEAVYGPDALTFDPDRVVPPSVNRYGFAFGAGPHMCYGMPIVMGTEGSDGSLVHLLKRVLRVGARPDPDFPVPGPPLEATRGIHSGSRADQYRVTFPGRAAQKEMGAR